MGVIIKMTIGEKICEKKHGIDVIVTHWGAINEGNMGHTYHTVQAKITKIFNLE